jgi:signal transduction histidine kinase/GAF domain-containing protein
MASSPSLYVRSMKTPTASGDSHLAALVAASAALAAVPASAEPDDVYATLYSRVSTLLDVPSFLVSHYDAAEGMIRCGYAVVDGEVWDAATFPALPLGGGPTSQVIRSGTPILVPDVQAEGSAWKRRQIGDGPLIRSMLLAPMTRGGDVVGVVQAQSYELDSYDADDAAALSILANQAAAAIEAIDLHREADRAAARARLLDDVGTILGESLDLPVVLQALAEQVAGVMGAGCAVYLLKDGGTRYDSRIVQYRDPRLAALNEGVLAEIPPSLTETFVGRLILRGEPIFIGDVMATPLEPAVAAAIAEMDVRQALFAPIRRRDEILGALLVLGTSTFPLTAADMSLAMAVAVRAAAAIDHAGLHTEVAEQRRFLAHLIEAMPVGIAVIRGPEQTYEVANAAYRAFKGTDDLIGKPYTDVAARDPEDWPTARRRIGQVVRDRTPFRITDRPYAMPDGTTRYYSFDLSPLPADRRRPAGLLILSTDTTDRVLAAQRLEQIVQQAEAHAAEMRTVIAGMAEAVVVTSPDGVVTITNDAALALFGGVSETGDIRPWELANRFNARWLDGMPFDSDEARAIWESDEPRVGLEFLITTEQGRERAIRMSVAPLPGPDGGRGGTVAIMDDITERRALEEAREEFLAQASHELRTPLTSMLGYLQLTMRRFDRDPNTSPVVRESVGAALIQTERLRGLVNDLLDATRLRQGRLELRRGACDLTALTASVVEELREATHGPHRIVLRRPDHAVVGPWDADRLRQVLVNLVDNALKYSPAGGAVTVGITRTRHEAVVTVEDQGVGIPASELPKLFRPFGRADHPPARNIPGFGLGLYICKDIVERHGGHIGVTSCPGEGTSVTFSLPLNDVEDGHRHIARPSTEGETP